MAKFQITIEQAQRKVDAIDKRIDAVRAELHRVTGVSADNYDVMTNAGYMDACAAFDVAWRANEALREIERTLFVRRAAAADVRDVLAAKEARRMERAETKRLAAEWDAKHRCPTCGGLQMAAYGCRVRADRPDHRRLGCASLRRGGLTP